MHRQGNNNRHETQIRRTLHSEMSTFQFLYGVCMFRVCYQGYKVTCCQECGNREAVFKLAEVRAGGDRALWAFGRKCCPRYLIPLHPRVTTREGQERLIESSLTEFPVGIRHRNPVATWFHLRETWSPLCESNKITWGWRLTFWPWDPFVLKMHSWSPSVDSWIKRTVLQNVSKWRNGIIISSMYSFSSSKTLYMFVWSRRSDLDSLRCF